MAPYLAWMLGEYAHASAVLACVAGGITLRRAPRPTSAERAAAGDAGLGPVVFVANGVLFLLIGLQLRGLARGRAGGRAGAAAGPGGGWSPRWWSPCAWSGCRSSRGCRARSRPRLRAARPDAELAGALPDRLDGATRNRVARRGDGAAAHARRRLAAAVPLRAPVDHVRGDLLHAGPAGADARAAGARAPLPARRRGAREEMEARSQAARSALARLEELAGRAVGRCGRARRAPRAVQDRLRRAPEASRACSPTAP